MGIFVFWREIYNIGGEQATIYYIKQCFLYDTDQVSSWHKFNLLFYYFYLLYHSVKSLYSYSLEKPVCLNIVVFCSRLMIICLGLKQWSLHYFMNGTMLTRSNFSEILIELVTFQLKKMRLKVSFAKWLALCFGFSVLLHANYDAISRLVERLRGWSMCFTHMEPG